MGDLSIGSDAVVNYLPTQAAAIRETAIVFGGKDANGYATRISVLVGTSTPGAGPTQPSTPTLPTPPLPPIPPLSGSSGSDGDVYSFLFGGAS